MPPDARARSRQRLDAIAGPARTRPAEESPRPVSAPVSPVPPPWPSVDPAVPGAGVGRSGGASPTVGALRAASTAYAARHGTEHLRRATGARSGPRWSVPRALAGVALSVVLLVAGVVALRSQALAAGTPVTFGTPAPAGTTAATAGVVVVHVVGAVGAPGVVRLAAGARLLDAVAAAGGSAPDADLSAVNLARVLVDGEQVVVPVLGQQTSPAATRSAVPGDDRLDLNSASLAQLDELPGVGPVLAQRILDRRPFTAVDELDEVSGIGSALLERLRPKVRV